MFKFIKQILINPAMLFSDLLSVNSLECISLKNQESRARPEIVNISGNNPIFYPFSIKINKCSSNCNNISDPYARICVPDTVKNLNVKVFHLMPSTNDTRHIKWHETCKCICRLDEIICNSNQRWNKDKSRCECKELIDKGVCGKGFIWNPRSCECECDKSYDIGRYLDYSDCKCKKNLVDPLVEEYAENIEEVKLAKLTPEDENNGKCNSYVVHKVLFFIFFIISIGIGIYFVYRKFVGRNKYNLPY